MRKNLFLKWGMLAIVVIIACIIIALSFHNTSFLASQLRLNPYLTAGLVEVLFGSLLFIRGIQRATQKNVPAFLETGYFVSLAFVTGVNIYGLAQSNLVIGIIVGLSISGAMWLMESTLVWLWVDSDKPHQKSLRERKREAKAEVKEMEEIQKILYMKHEAKKPSLQLIKKARKNDERRKIVEGDGLPEFFLIEQLEPVKQIVAEPITIDVDVQETAETAEIVPLRKIGFHTELDAEQQAENPMKSTIEHHRTPSTEQELTKTEKAIQYVMSLIEQDEEFTVSSVAKKVDCARSTASVAINEAKKRMAQ